MIKAIVFDMGGVLVNDDWPAYAKVVAQKHGIDEEEYLKFHIDLTHAKHDVGMCTTTEFVQEISDHFNIHLSLEEFDKDTLEIFHPINMELMDLIGSLKGKYLLGMLSDNNPLFVERYRNTLKLDRYFDFQIFSCEAKMSKPRDEIYKLMLVTASLRPDEIVFIDDKKRNLKPAKKLGIHTILFTDAIKMVEEFKRLGIDV